MKIVLFDPTDVNESLFRTANCKYFHGDVEEEDPPNMSEPLGKEVVI